MATFRKRGEKWFVEVYVAGRRKGKTFATKKEANEWARLAELNLTAQEASVHTLRDACNKYKSEIAKQTKNGQNSAQMALRVAEKLPDMSVSDFKRGDFSAWKTQRMKEVSEATVRREITAINSVLRACVEEWGWIAANPMIGIKSPGRYQPRLRGVAQHEIDAIVTALGFIENVRPWLKKQEAAICFLLGIETAMRAAEIVSLHWPDVHLSQRFVRLKKTKNEDGRDVPLSSRAIELFGLIENKGGKVFRLSVSTLDTLFRKNRDKTEYKDVHFHDSRSEGITRMSKKLDVLELARAIGHRDIKSLMYYYNTPITVIADKLG